MPEMPDLFSGLSEFDRKCVLAYAECNMSMHGASKILNVSYPAVRYHLLKVAGMTGYNPANFKDLVHLMWVLTERKEFSDAGERTD